MSDVPITSRNAWVDDGDCLDISSLPFLCRALSLPRTVRCTSCSLIVGCIRRICAVFAIIYLHSFRSDSPVALGVVMSAPWSELFSSVSSNEVIIVGPMSMFVLMAESFVCTHLQHAECHLHRSGSLIQVLHMSVRHRCG